MVTSVAKEGLGGLEFLKCGKTCFGRLRAKFQNARLVPKSDMRCMKIMFFSKNLKIQKISEILVYSSYAQPQ